ncbi:MAG: DUF4349 domain-containing protein [Clostridia bacterium]
MMMKNKAFLTILAILMIFAVAGCASLGGQKTDSSEGAYYPGTAPAPDPSRSNESGGFYEDENQKTILTGNVTVEVDDFDSAMAGIRASIGDSGYIQNSNIYKQPAYYNDEKIMLSRASLTIRIHKSRFDAFVAGIHDVGLVINESTNAEDISDMYYDTEARHKLLKDEKARLELYLTETKDPDVFFKTQSRITEVIYEMERLKGTINKWDDRIEFSTVYVEIKEQHPDETSALAKPMGFFERVWENMKSSVGFLGEVLIVMAGLIPVFIVMGMVALAVLAIVRLSRRKKK